MSKCRIGDLIKTTAVLHPSKTYYINFGVTSKLKDIYGLSEDEPIYNVIFEVSEVMPNYPDNPDDVCYYAYYESGTYTLIQPNVILFTIQFPFQVFKYQGQPRGKSRFGIVVKLKLKTVQLIG